LHLGCNCAFFHSHTHTKTHTHDWPKSYADGQMQPAHMVVRERD